MPFSSHMGLYIDFWEKIRCIVYGSTSYPPIGSRAVKRVLDTWRSRSDAGISDRPLGFYERAQKVLASTDYHCIIVARWSNCICRRNCGCTICVYAFLVHARYRLSSWVKFLFLKFDGNTPFCVLPLFTSTSAWWMKWFPGDQRFPERFIRNLFGSEDDLQTA